MSSTLRGNGAQCLASTYKDRRVLVTGHTGFKGSWLTTWLLSLGAEVCGYSDKVATTPSLFELSDLAGHIRHEIGDIRDQKRFGQVVASFRPDFIFHLAAQAIVSVSYNDPVETISTNVLGTAVVLQTLRSVEWPCTVVIVTSDKCYENVEWPWGYRENDRLGGKDVYSASKGGAELVAHSFLFSFFSRRDGVVRFATSRAGNVIGGGDWAADRIVADCVRAWLRDDVVEIRSPAATRPWQHVLEPLSGYLLLGSRMSADPSFHGESFNFGPRAEQNSTVVELLRDLAEVWGHADPARSFRVTGNIPFHEAGLLKLNCDKALLMLKWEANLSYGECVSMTGEWYRDVLKHRADALDITKSQIRSYESIAAERGRTWQVGGEVN